MSEGKKEKSSKEMRVREKLNAMYETFIVE